MYLHWQREAASPHSQLITARPTCATHPLRLLKDTFQCMVHVGNCEACSTVTTMEMAVSEHEPATSDAAGL